MWVVRRDQEIGKGIDRAVEELTSLGDGDSRAGTFSNHCPRGSAGASMLLGLWVVQVPA